jgi:serine/threonine protein kinase
MLFKAMGLSFIHQAGIIHKDIKPENILVDSHNDICITDFGCAYLHESWPLEADMAYCHDLGGTWKYMAPEVWANKWEGEMITNFGAAVDYWSLGCIFFELVADVTMASLYEFQFGWET